MVVTLMSLEKICLLKLIYHNRLFKLSQAAHVLCLVISIKNMFGQSLKLEFIAC